MSDILEEYRQKKVAKLCQEARELCAASSFAAAPCSAPVECEESVISKIRLRRDAGRTKYGTTMERTDLDRLRWLQHAQEEAMDLAVYLEKLMRDEQFTQDNT